jgi:hypothetical protein
VSVLCTPVTADIFISPFLAPFATTRSYREPYKSVKVLT